MGEGISIWTRRVLCLLEGGHVPTCQCKTYKTCNQPVKSHLKHGPLMLHLAPLMRPSPPRQPMAVPAPLPAAPVSQTTGPSGCCWPGKRARESVC